MPLNRTHGRKHNLSMTMHMYGSGHILPSDQRITNPSADRPPYPVVTEGCGGAENIVTVTIPHILSLSNGIKS